MKQKIFITLLSCVISIAVLNSYTVQDGGDISLNQVGGALIYNAMSHETTSPTGNLTAAVGGAAIVKGFGACVGWWSAGALLTPAGWIVAGVVAAA